MSSRRVQVVGILVALLAVQMLVPLAAAQDSGATVIDVRIETQNVQDGHARLTMSDGGGAQLFYDEFPLPDNGVVERTVELPEAGPVEINVNASGGSVPSKGIASWTEDTTMSTDTTRCEPGDRLAVTWPIDPAAPSHDPQVVSSDCVEDTSTGTSDGETAPSGGGGAGGGQSSLTSNSEGEIVEVASLPYGLINPSAATDGRYAYVAGGGSGSSSNDAILRYDPDRDEWREMVRLPQPGGTIVRHGSSFLVFANRDVYRWTPGGDAFEELPDLEADWDPEEAFSDGRYVYLLGGTRGDTEFPAQILRYDADAGQTETMASRLPSGRSVTSLVWDGSAAWTFGGAVKPPDSEEDWSDTITDEILRFDPAGDEVSVAGNLPQGSASTSAAYDGEHAYVFCVGGQRTVTRFTPPTASTGASVVTLRGVDFPTSVCGSGAVWLDGSAYVIGGDVPGTGDQAYRFTPSSGAGTGGGGGGGGPATMPANWPPPPGPVIQEVAPIPIRTQAGAAFSDGRYIYHVGGCACGETNTEADHHKGIYRYDPVTDTWEMMSAQVDLNDGLDTVALVGRSAYLFHPGREVVVYDLDADEATVLEGILPPGYGRTFGVVEYDGRYIWLVGGQADHSADGDAREIIRFDPTTNQATVAGELPQALFDTVGVFDGERIWTFGGSAGAPDAGRPGADVLTVDVSTGGVTQMKPLDQACSAMAAAFDGRHAWLFGECASRDTEVLRVDTDTGAYEPIFGVPGGTFGHFGTAASIDPYMYVVGGQGGESGSTRVLRFDPRALDGEEPRDEPEPEPEPTPHLEEVAPLPRPLMGGTAFAIGGHLYYVGGQDGREGSSAFYRYDPDADRWDTLRAELPGGQNGLRANVDTGEAVFFVGQEDALLKWDVDADATLRVGTIPFRHDAALASQVADMFLLGGQGRDEDTSPSRSIVFVNAGAGTFEHRGDLLPEPIWFSGAFVHDGDAYAVGGHSPPGDTDAIVRYDPRTDDVLVVNRLPTPNAEMGVAYDDGSAYFFGGTGAPEMVVRYDPAANELETLPIAIPGGRSHTWAAWLDGHAYIVGGLDHSTGQPTASVLRFDPSGAHATNGRGTPPPDTEPREPRDDREPCYDLLTCPLGDPSAVLERLKTVPSRVETEAGRALEGVPVLLFRGEGGLLQPEGAFRTDAEGRFTAPAELDAPPTYLAALVGGHLALKSLVDLEADLVSGQGLRFDLPEALGDTGAFQGLSDEDVERLRRSVEDVKPVRVGDAPQGQAISARLDGYAGIKAVEFVALEARSDVQVVIVRMNDKGTDRIPTPPQGTPLTWFGAQVVDGEGREVPLLRIDFVLELPAGVRSASRLVVNHFRADTGAWESLEPDGGEVEGEVRVRAHSLSLFSVAEVRPSALASAVESLSGWGYLLPAVGALAVAGGSVVGYRRLRRSSRDTTRGPDADKEPGEDFDPTALPSVPAGAAALEPVDLPEDELFLSGIGVTLGGNRILSDVSFGLRKGEVLAVLGPSGCGKSTALRALLGEVPHSGEASLFGLRADRDQTEVRRAVGYVSQETELYPDMTVQENVEYFGKQYGLKRRELKTAVPALLRTLGLEDRARERVRFLSGGQQRRASIAATLIHSPALLVLDEPTSGLDHITRRNLWKFLGDVNRSLGVSVIVTTHFLDEADFADQVVIMNRGTVVASNAPQELIGSLPGGGKAVVIELSSSSEAIEGKIRDALGPLEDEGLVRKVELSGYAVRCFVSDPQVASRRLFETFADIDVPIKKVTTEDCGMDDVFRHYAGEDWAGSGA